MRRLLVPVDFSERSRPQLDYAFALAELTHVEVDVLHVIAGPSTTRAAVDAFVGRPLPHVSRLDESTAYQQLGELVDGCHRSGIVPQVLVEAGDVATAIVRVAAEAPADLVVLSTRGHRGVAELLLGSVAHAVITTAGCPVVTIGEAARRWTR